MLISQQKGSWDRVGFKFSLSVWSLLVLLLFSYSYCSPTLLLHFLMISHEKAGVFVNSFFYNLSKSDYPWCLALECIPTHPCRPTVDLWCSSFPVNSNFISQDILPPSEKVAAFLKVVLRTTFLLPVCVARVLCVFWKCDSPQNRVWRPEDRSRYIYLLHIYTLLNNSLRKSLLCRRCLQAVTSRLMAAGSQTPPASNSLLEKVLGAFYVSPPAWLQNSISVVSACYNVQHTFPESKSTGKKQLNYSFEGTRKPFSMSSHILWIEMAMKNS